MSDFSAVVEVVVQFALQVDPLDLDPVDLVRLITLAEQVDVALAVQVLLGALDVHLGVQRVLLRSRFPRRASPAPTFDEQDVGGGEQHQEREHGGQAAPHRASGVPVEGAGSLGFQAQGLHVGSVFYLFALVVVDERLVEGGRGGRLASQGQTGRTAHPGAGERVRPDDVDHLEVPLMPRFHLERETQISFILSNYCFIYLFILLLFYFFYRVLFIQPLFHKSFVYLFICIIIV